MDWKNKKILIATVVIAFFSILLIVILNFTSRGFNISTYATENLIVDQIEDILSKDSSQKEVTEVYKGTIEGEYLAIFMVSHSDIRECVIVNYEEVGQLGEHKILEVTRVVKGENGLVVIDINEKQIIFSNVDKEEYIGFNILDNNGELVKEVLLEELEEISIERIDSESFILEYEDSKLKDGVRVELVKKNDE